MTAAAATAAQITVAVLLALVTSFQQGLTHLQNKNYDKAVAAFTEVIDKKEPGSNVLRGQALYWRATAYAELQQKDKALADLAGLLTVPGDADLKAQAAALFGKLGGEWRSLVPKESPKLVFERLTTAAADGDLAKAMDCFGGDLLAYFTIMNTVYTAAEGVHGGNFWQEMLRELVRGETLVNEKVGVTAKDYGRAWLTIAGDDDITLTVLLEPKNDKWQMTRLVTAVNHGQQLDASVALQVEDGVAAPGVVISPRAAGDNLTRLKQVMLAVRMYEGDYGGFPPALGDLKENGYLGDDAAGQWQNPKTKVRKPFLYCSAFAGQSPSERSVMVVAAPEAVDDKREVAFADGHVEIVAEADFAKRAAAQKWKLDTTPVKKEMVPEERRKAVAALVAKLGDADRQVRRDSRKQLEAMGADAVPVLEEHANDADPEIRLIIKELLSK